MTDVMYATIADLSAVTGDSIAENDARATRLLQFASAKINDFCGQAFPIAPATEVPLTVVAVCAAMAARSWTNPSGAQSVEMIAGPSTLSTSFGSGQTTASVPMALRASEKDDLSPYKVKRSGISTISTYRPVPCEDLLFVNPSDGGKPFPWPNPDVL